MSWLGIGKGLSNLTVLLNLGKCSCQLPGAQQASDFIDLLFKFGAVDPVIAVEIDSVEGIVWICGVIFRQLS